MVIGLLIAIFASTIAALLKGEVEGWAPQIAACLVERASSKLAAEKQDRYREEWLAHLDQVPAPVSKLIVAFGLVITVERLRLSPRERALYAADKAFAVFALVVLAPLFLLIAWLLYRETGAHPLQKWRYRHKGRELAIVQFNTAGSIGPDGNRQPMGPVGKVVRVTGLQGVPEVYNLLRGDLTLFRNANRLRMVDQSRYTSRLTRRVIQRKIRQLRQQWRSGH